MNSTELALLTVSIIFPILASAAVVLRFLARRVRSGPKADDWVCVAALILCIALGVNSIIAVALELIGRPQKELGLKKAPPLLKIIYGDSFMVFASLSVIKVSILLFYKRIFITKKFGIACNIMIGVMVAWYLGSFFALIFSRTPISNHWNPRPTNNHYNINFPAFLISHASLDLFFDVVILSFPLPVISSLKMGVNRKFAIIGIFWLGFFCVIAEAVRIYYFHQFLYEDLAHHADAFGPVVANIFIWSRIEPCCSVVAACLPTFGPLLKDGRTPESVIASIRSVLSIRSSSNSMSTEKRLDSSHGSANPSRSLDDEEAARKEWHRLHTNPGATAAIRNERKGPGLKNGQIVLEKTFASE
ncbi:hypothetical protein B0O99DRAFT_735736 [Bisporella sp. PMI_857]|nr:hypothetical protein B0O99DRAFT_735736 [Bisporella sp. PMI_857]